MKYLKPILIVLVVGIVGLASYWKFSKVPNTAPLKSSLLVSLEPDSLKTRVQGSGQKLFLINLWATWCAPCKVEFPALLKVAKEFSQIDLILISLDGNDELLAAEEFLKSHGVSFKSYFKGDQDMEVLAAQIPSWNGAIPSSFLVNNKLEIVESWVGETTEEDFRAKILPHIANSN